jgi:predicted metalloprotease
MRALLALGLALLVSACGGPEAGGSQEATPSPVTADESTTSAAPDPTTKEVALDAVGAGTTGLQKWWSEFAAPDVRLIELGSVSGGRFTACGGGDFTTGNAYYCGGDNTVYLDLNFLQGQQSLEKVTGVAAFIVAHELGHAWEAQRGYLPDEGATTVKPELFADCISGALLVEMGEDLEVAARSAFTVGNYAVDSPYFHGTPEQRREAVRLGAAQGHDACDAYLR